MARKPNEAMRLLGEKAARWLRERPELDYRRAAIEFGIKPHHVHAAWYRLGFPPRKRGSRPGGRRTGLGVAAARWLQVNPDSTFRAAGEAFGVSKQRVEQAWAYLGLPPRRGVPHAPRGRGADAARWLYSNPQSTARDAGEMFGVTESTVRLAWAQLGFGPRKVGGRFGPVTDAVQWLDENPKRTIKEASKRFGISEHSIRCKISRLKKVR